MWLLVLSLAAPGLRRGSALAATRTETAEHAAHRVLRAPALPRLQGAAFFPDQDYSTPADPKTREHVFVVGPETSGTRLIAKQVATDLGMPDAARWDGHFADADSADVVFHVSLPWGETCEGKVTEPTIPTWGARYNGLNGFVSVPAGHPPRFNLDVRKLLETYEARGEKVQVILVARDPEVSLLGKMAAGHCGNRQTALDEQAKAFDLLMNAPHVANVHTVCYEDLVTEPKAALTEVRAALGVNGTEVQVFDGNKKYTKLPEKYECTKMLADYVKLCPRTALAQKYADCVH